MTITEEANENMYIKCRVDEENKVNVVVQTTFDLNYILNLPKIIQCAELFLTNNYPVIIIESMNGGGIIQLSIEMHQLLQMRTVDRAYLSYRMTDISKNLNAENQGRSISKTCKLINNISELKAYILDDVKEGSITRDYLLNVLFYIRSDIYNELYKQYKSIKVSRIYNKWNNFYVDLPVGVMDEVKKYNPIEK